MNCIFIYNPISGNGHINKNINYINERLKSKYDSVEIHKTESLDDLIDTVKESSKYDHLIFAGGDGTFNNIVNVISTMDKKPVLGFIPSGTANDMGKNLNISKNIKKALDVILNGNIKEHDVGKINGKHFIYVTGCGNLCSIAYNTKQKNKKVFGKLAYIFNGLKDFFKPKKIKANVEINGELIEGVFSLILVMNSKRVGGFKVNKDGHLNNGKLDIVLVKKSFFNVIRFLIFGINKKQETKYYIKYTSDNVNINVCDDVIWTVDGEKGVLGKANITNLPSHIQIIQG